VLREWKSLFQKTCVKTVIKKSGLGRIRLIVVAVIS
jgi:cobalamin biosynthesis protein CobT